MDTELHSPLARIRIAALQHHIREQSAHDGGTIIRRRTSTVRQMPTNVGKVFYARRRSTTAKTECDHAHVVPPPPNSPAGLVREMSQEQSSSP